MAKHRGLYKRNGSDIWWYRYADANVKIQRKSSLSTSYKEAETKLRDIKTAIGKGIEPQDNRKMGIMTFDELAERYLQFIIGEGSYRNKRHNINRLREREVIVNGQPYRLGGLPLRAFTVELVE